MNLPDLRRHVPEAEPGQVWRWSPREGGEFYHCVLLSFVAHVATFDEWQILDLDTDEAGRVTNAYLFLGFRYSDKSSWKRIT